MAIEKKVSLYAATTPNGFPMTMFLEELSVPYDLVKLSILDKDIGKVHNQVKSPWFLEINPNGRIPAITHEGFNVFETSAILLYLQQHFDKENVFGYDPKESPKEFSTMMQWLMFVHGGVGPMQGQANHFVKFAPERIPYATTRYLNETRRLYSVLESQLSKNAYLAGDKYTIADVKAYPWVSSCSFCGVDVDEFPSVKAWVAKIAAREATQRGYKTLKASS